MTTLPLEIQNDTSLFGLNETLKNLRGDFGQAVSKMESGSFSIKKTFEGLIDEMNDTIDAITSRVEVAVIPEADFTDFENGDATLDEFGSLDIISYYNELKKLRLSLYGVTVALLSLQDSPTKPVTPSFVSESGVLDVLDTREFLEQGAENPVFEAQQSFKYYTIVQGDTLQKIASEIYDGDYHRWPEIAQANQLNDSDLLDDNLVGQVLKIPVDAATANRVSSGNLVFETFFDGVTQDAIDQFIYGRDFDLFNGQFQISGTSDLKRMSGITCVVKNLEYRFGNTKGALNPINPTWGLLALDESGDVPFVIMLDRFLSDMEAQATEDPRVLNAAILRKNLRIIGDRMDIEMQIDLLGGRNISENFNIANRT